MTVLQILVLFPTALLAFFLPGYALWSSLRDADESPGMATVLAILTLSILISGISAMLLAQLGIFSLVGWLVTLLVFSLILLSRNLIRREFAWPFRSPADLRGLLVFAVLVVFAAQVFRPSEWIVAGRDPGVYFNTAAQIARNGSILVHDRLMAALPESYLSSLYLVLKTTNCQYGLYGSQHLGFYIYDAQNGLVVPQFLHLFPSLMAVFFAAGGPTAALLLTPLLSLISLATVFAVARTISSWEVGIATVLLLAFNFAEVYFSRGPYPEILMQLLIFGAVLAVMQVVSGHETRFYSVVFAIAVGGLTMTKEEGWVSAFLLAGFAAYTIGRPLLTRRFATSICLLICLGGYSAFSSFVFWRLYMSYTIEGMLFGRIDPCLLPSYTFLLIVIGLAFSVPAALLIGALLPRLSLGRFLSIMQTRLRSTFTTGLIMSLVGILLYGYYVHPSGEIINNSWNLVKLGWYVGNIPGLVGGLIGMVLLVAKDTRRNKFLAAVFIAYSIFLASALITPDQPWWARRFIAGIIPLIAIGVSEFAWAVSKLNFRRVKVGKPLAIVLFLVVLILTARHLPLIENYVEYKGVVQQVDVLALQFPASAVILYSANDVYALWVAPPLRYVHGLNPIPFRRFDQNVVNAVNGWLGEGFHVFLLRVPENQVSQFGMHFVVQKAGSVTISYVQLSGLMTQEPYGYFPSNVTTLNITYQIVEVRS